MTRTAETFLPSAVDKPFTKCFEISAPEDIVAGSGRAWLSIVGKLRKFIINLRALRESLLVALDNLFMAYEHHYESSPEEIPLKRIFQKFQNELFSLGV